MADEKIVISISGNINADIANRIRDIAKAATEASNDIKLFKAELKGFGIGNGVRTAIADVNRFKRELQAAIPAAKGLAKAVDEVDASGLRAGKSITATSGALRGLVGSIGAVVAVSKWAEASDNVAKYTNSLKVTGLEGENLAQVLEGVRGSALRNGQSMTGLAQIYQRVALAGKDIGATQAETLKFVDAVALSLRISGQSATSAAGAMLQLGQAVGSARVQAEEINGILDGMPAILQAAAVGIGGFEGSVSKLVRFIKDGGDISGAELFRGINAGFLLLQEQADRTSLTINQAIQNLQTKFEQWTESTGVASKMLVAAISLIGDNLNILIPIVAALAAAFALVTAVKIAQEFADMTKQAWAFSKALVAVNLGTILWTAGILALVAAVAGLAYIMASFIMGQEEVNKAIAEGIDKTKDFVANLTGLGGEVTKAGGASGQAAAAMGQFSTSSGKATTAVNTQTQALKAQKETSKNWKENIILDVDKVAERYSNLTREIQKTHSAVASLESMKGYTPPTLKGNDDIMSLADWMGRGNSSTSSNDNSSSANSNSSSSRSQSDSRSFGFGSTARYREQLRNQQTRQTQNGGSGGGVAAPPQTGGAMAAGGGAINNYFSVVTPDAESFRRSRGQIASDFAATMAAGS